MNFYFKISYLTFALILSLEFCKCFGKSSDEESSAMIGLEMIIKTALATRKWISYLRYLIINLLRKVFSIFLGTENARKTVDTLITKTWTSIKEQMPESYKNVLKQYEQIFLYLENV